MLGVHDRVVEQARKLCTDAIISAEALDLFLAAVGVTQEAIPILRLQKLGLDFYFFLY